MIKNSLKCIETQFQYDYKQTILGQNLYITQSIILALQLYIQTNCNNITYYYRRHGHS